MPEGSECGPPVLPKSPEMGLRNGVEGAGAAENTR